MSSENTAYTHDDVIAANVELHSKLAACYDETEPQFRPENIEYVEGIIRQLVKDTNAKTLLDLGCGTGFIINIAKKYVKEIVGVDATQSMLDRVSTTGSASIRLACSDAGAYKVEEEHYQLVTAYSFLHHLFDVVPTIKVAYSALQKGGKFYVDLEPNYYFWDSISRLDPSKNYSPAVQREHRALCSPLAALKPEIGVNADTFTRAEFGKSIKGGFREEEMTQLLRGAGFSEITFKYRWFLGQGLMNNDQSIEPALRKIRMDATESALLEVLPVSRPLFKYVGFIATK